MNDVIIFNVEHRTSFIRTQPTYGVFVIGRTSPGWDLEAPLDHELFDASGQGRMALGFSVRHDTLSVLHNGRVKTAPHNTKKISYY